jgi:gluconate 5-dehydrogenase
VSRFLDDLFALNGRTAVVTGGNSGIGREIGRALAHAGARVVLIARGQDRLRDAADELRAAGCTADYVGADVGDRDAVRRVAEPAVVDGGFSST